MRRRVRVYKYTCDDCGWEAFRGEIIPADLCSKCGSTHPPTVSTEDRWFEMSEEVTKAAEYVMKLAGGADPDELEKEYGEGETGNFGHMARVRRIDARLVGGMVTTEKKADPTSMKVLFGSPVVY